MRQELLSALWFGTIEIARLQRVEMRCIPLRILVAHNAYQQSGGEDVVFEQETSMLAAAGYDVRRFKVDNNHIFGLAGKITAARSVIHNRSAVNALVAEIRSFDPSVVHFHNFFPTLSPAALDAIARRRIPAVITLHNYRLICPGGLLLRGGAPCEDCIGRIKLPSVLHRCYRSSFPGTAMVAAMGQYFKGLLEIYPHAISLIALTAFAKTRFVADGFPSEMITVRGNFIADCGEGPLERDRRVVFVGRLSPEKGIDTLLAVAPYLGATIEIIGDGPDLQRQRANAPSNVIFRGHLNRTQVLERIKSATALAVPSRWYEGFPIVVLEAMAAGTPILASKLGSLEEIVTDGETGLLITPDDSAAWLTGLTRILANRDFAKTLADGARARYVATHSPTPALASLEHIYRKAQSRLTSHFQRSSYTS